MKVFSKLDTSEGRGVLILDYNRDGLEDFIVTRYAKRPAVFEAISQHKNDFVRVRVRQCCDPLKCRESIGAKVSLYGRKESSNGWALIRMMQIGARNAFLVSSDTFAHFGLGASFENELKLEIVWPRSVSCKNENGCRRVYENFKINSELEACPYSATLAVIENKAGVRKMRVKVEEENDIDCKIEDHKIAGVSSHPIIRRIAQRAALRISQRLVKESFRREIDGSNNNLKNGEWGKAGERLRRLTPSDYSDGVDAPSGRDRPSARYLSNRIFHYSSSKKKKTSKKKLSALIMHFGQFLAHDISLTTTVANLIATENISIPVPRGDPTFDVTGTGHEVIRMRRSIFKKRVNTVREQVNKVTSYLDGSMIYGSDDRRLAALRLGRYGKLAGKNEIATTPHHTANHIGKCPFSLPLNEQGLANDNPLARVNENLSLSGDIRTNIQPGLHALHTLWYREHNFWCDQILHEMRAMGKNLDDEFIDDGIFLEARAIVEAELQMITYREYLPALIGRDVFGENGKFPYDGYDETIDASTSTEFSTAAMRISHSFVNEFLLYCDVDGGRGRLCEENDIETTCPGKCEINMLKDKYFEPRRKEEYDEAFDSKETDPTDKDVDKILLGMIHVAAEPMDLQIADAIRNHLFGPREVGGVDLHAIDIQRGRDHGIPSYKNMRRYVGLHDDNEDVQNILKEIYNSENNDYDAIVGMLAEADACYRNEGKRSRLGSLAEYIVIDQFRRLRDGDRFFYLNRFQKDEVHDLESIGRLQNVLERNTFNNMKGLWEGDIFYYNE
eukprot:g4322.t1